MLGFSLFVISLVSGHASRTSCRHVGGYYGSGLFPVFRWRFEQQAVGLAVNSLWCWRNNWWKARLWSLSPFVLSVCPVQVVLQLVFCRMSSMPEPCPVSSVSSLQYRVWVNFCKWSKATICIHCEFDIIHTCNDLGSVHVQENLLQVQLALTRHAFFTNCSCSYCDSLVTLT